MGSSIVVGTDGSPTASEAVRHAANLAKSMQAKLHLVQAYKEVSPESVMPTFPGEAWLPPEAVDSLREIPAEIEKELGEMASRLRAEGVDVEPHVRSGPAAKVICDIADEEKAEIIVVGNRGMHGARRLLGSVPSKVSHHAKCTVMIVQTC